MDHLSYSMFLKNIHQLDKEQKQKLLELLQAMNGKDRTGPISSLTEIRENRFKEGHHCIHCGSDRIRNYGTYRDRQRYHCKNCGRTYNDLTNTPLHGTKKLDKWGKFLEYMLEGYSLAKCSKLLKIHVSTAFAWRHKVLNALCRKNNSPLRGIVEIDATYERLSFKGQRSLERKAHKRGKKSTKPGINKEQACILIARDREKKTYCQLASLGRFNNKDVDQLLIPEMNSKITLCTDGETPFLTFCSKHKIAHEVILPEKRVKAGIYHIQNVNSFHSRYKDWHRRFKGTATKYVDNYLRWFSFLETVNRMEPRKKLNQFLQDITESSMKLKSYNFSKYYQMLFLEICA